MPELARLSGDAPRIGRCVAIKGARVGQFKNPMRDRKNATWRKADLESFKPLKRALEPDP